MLDSFVWFAFCACPPLRLLAVCVLFSTALAVLNCESPPLLTPARDAVHVERDGVPQRPSLVQGERTLSLPLRYSRTELFAVSPSPLTPDLTSHLRLLGIGAGLPRKRYRKKKSPVSRNDNLLKVLYLNSQSCRQKATHIHDLILQNNADILILCETWLHQQGDEAYIAAMNPVGYDFHSFPRTTSRGGGIAVVVKTCLSASLALKLLNYSTFECVELSLTLNQIAATCVCLYRPPPSKRNKLSNSSFLREFPELLSVYASARSDVFFVGDFNFHFDNSTDPQVNRIRTLLCDHGLSQLVTVPTHRHGHILDWVVVRSEKSLLTVEAVQDCADLSDHFLIVCSLALTRPPPPMRLVTSRNLKAVNPADLQADVKAVAEFARELPADLDLDSIVQVYNNGLQQALDRHAPVVTRRVRDRSSAPWMSDDVRELRRRRRRAERKWRKTHLTVHRQIFTNARDAVSVGVQAAKRQFYNEQIDSAASSSKQLFSVTNELLGKTKSKVLPTNIPRKDLPQSFCDFFAGKIFRIRDELDSRDCAPPSFAEYDGPMFDVFASVSEADIRTLILQSPTKSCMLDPFPTSLTKQCLDDIVPIVTTIVNVSLSSGLVPSNFKQAVVVPLLKKPGLDCNDFKNYRPVSNLPFISKILEKAVLKQLQKHLVDNDLLEVKQSAYRKDHSTETAVLSVLDGLLAKADDRLVSLLALLDLSAAFDTLDHSILLQRLETTFGVRGTVLRWFASYVCERSSSVVVDGVLSSPAPLAYGVPQGSVLGPVLFTLYSQPLSDVISANDCDYHKYADDTELSQSAPLDDFSTVQTGVESCVVEVLSWMNSNKLMLNTDKTELMPVGSSARLELVGGDSAMIGGSRVDFKSSVKYLGVKIDSTLSMNDQISSICRACFLELRKIASIRPYLTESACVRLVTALVTSRLDYCNSALAGLPAEQISRLQRVQNASARLVLQKRKTDHVTPLLKELHWLPVSFRVQYKLAVLAYRHFDGTLPTYLSASLCTYHPSRTLRSSDEKLLKKNKKKLENRRRTLF